MDAARRRVGSRGAALLATWLAGGGAALAADDAGSLPPFEPAAGSTHSLQETRLVESLFDLRQGRLDSALGTVSDLIRAQPDFTLAHLVAGDVLSALAHRLPEFGSAAPPELVSGLHDEARARLRHYVSVPPPGTVPASLLEVPPQVDSIVLVDLEQYRLYLYDARGGRLARRGDYYVSIGKGGTEKRFEGDEKTPVGVYVVNDYLPGSRLPDLYGDGAFPMDYPNVWDRSLGRTGSGIWIHGTESERYSRPPLSSRGCVTLSNADFERLRERVVVDRTPVLLADSLDWVAPEVVAAERGEVRAALERWRSDWESRSTDRYLSHYAVNFRTDEMDRARFAVHKRRVNAGKKFIRVGLSEVGIYRYPGEKDTVRVEFVQRYESDSFRGTRRKQQFWRRDAAGEWKIVYEAGA